MFVTCVLMWAALSGPPAEIRVELTLPHLDVSPYHRPYVAVWLETPAREGVATLTVWHEKADWLKDLRQWWRKLGSSADYDAVSGATRKPGTYTVTRPAVDAAGKALPPGTYVLHVEAAREQGGRDIVRHEIELGAGPRAYTLQGDLELGRITIDISGGTP